MAFSKQVEKDMKDYLKAKVLIDALDQKIQKAQQELNKMIQDRQKAETNLANRKQDLIAAI